MFDIIFKPRGDLVDFQAWDDFAVALNQVVETAGDKVVLDMASVTRMSSSYIGSIISACKTAEEKSKEFTLVNVGPKLYDLLDMLKLTDMIHIERA